MAVPRATTVARSSRRLFFKPKQNKPPRVTALHFNIRARKANGKSIAHASSSIGLRQSSCLPMESRLKVRGPSASHLPAMPYTWQRLQNLFCLHSPTDFVCGTVWQSSWGLRFSRNLSSTKSCFLETGGEHYLDVERRYKRKFGSREPCSKIPFTNSREQTPCPLLKTRMKLTEESPVRASCHSHLAT